MAKILVVSNFITPPVMAGSTKCVESYTKLLKDLGHEVYYLYSGREHPQRIESAKEYWGDYFLYYKYSQLLRTANWVKRHLLNLLQRKYTIGYYYPLYGLASFVNRINKQEHFDTIIAVIPTR